MSRWHQMTHSKSGRALPRHPGRSVAMMIGLGTIFIIALAPPSFADASIISAPGPLTNITISPDLNCAVNHINDNFGEFFDDTACGTLVAVGGTLYGPATIPAGGGANPRTAFTPVSQTGPTGAGTVASPFLITTVVALGATGLRITENDSYIVGEETYRTDVTLANSGVAPLDTIIYRAGDCFLQDSDLGTGSVTAVTGGNAPACVAPSGRIEQWIPITTGSNYMEDEFSTVWARIGSQQAFPNTCQCANSIDNGAGLSWNKTVPAGGSVEVSHLTVFAPLGIQPLSMTKTADQGTVAPSASDGYTITVSNHNPSVASLTSITDTLPAGFAYTAGSTTGATTNNPTVSGQTLTWTGSFQVPASSAGNNGTISLHFGVRVSATPGTYTNTASGTADGLPVTGTGATAAITVTAPPVTTTFVAAAVTATPTFTG